MTTPNLPVDGSANMPIGAFTHTQIAQVLQNFSKGKYLQQAGARFPGIVSNIPAGSPLSELSPVGIINGLFADFLRTVSEASSADITHPGDLQALITKFFEGLPLVGEFVGLLEALTGSYSGDDAILLDIQQFVTGKWDLLTTLQHAASDLLSRIGQLLGGNVELGQLVRAVAGQERNWLEPFDAAASMEATAGWEWDGTVGRTKVGSARCSLDGAEHVQHSAAVDVVAGQELAIAGWLLWSGVTAGAGPVFVLRVLAYDTAGAVVGSQTVGQVTAPAAAGGWVELAGSWTVPVGAVAVRVRMQCTAAGTAGTVWWDDLSLRKPAQSLPQAWITGLGSALAGLGEDIQATIDSFMHGRGILGSDFSLSHFQDEVAKVFGPGSLIPQANVDGLGGALSALLPRSDWSTFLAGLGSSAGSGANGSTGVPLVDAALTQIGNLFGRAQAAQTNASNAAAAADAVAHVAVSTFTVDGLTYTKTQWTTPGTFTWSVPAPSPGMKIVRYDGVVIGGGDGGNCPQAQIQSPIPGGRAGGYLRLALDPSQVTGTSYTVTVGAGGTGATSKGNAGGTGGTTSIGSLWVSPRSGTASIQTSFGSFFTQAAPGGGGTGGPVTITGVDSSGNPTWGPVPGGPGGDALGGTGGPGGVTGGGWTGSTSSPGAGGSTGTQPSNDAFGGGGGGGGCGASGNAQAGANGGTPGGGGGSGGSWSGNLFYSPGKGGNGGGGYACVIVVQAPL